MKMYSYMSIVVLTINTTIGVISHFLPFKPNNNPKVCQLLRKLLIIGCRFGTLHGFFQVDFP
jgi:hypothetical protein